MLLFSSRYITPLLIPPISSSRCNADDLADYFLDRRRQHAGAQTEEALTRSQEALGRAEELLDETWRTTTEIATRASALGERAVRDAETRDGLLLGAAVLAVGCALFIALRSKGEVQAEQQPAVSLRRFGGRPDAYRLEDAELELGC